MITPESLEITALKFLFNLEDSKETDIALLSKIFSYSRQFTQQIVAKYIYRDKTVRLAKLLTNLPVPVGLTID